MGRSDRAAVIALLKQSATENSKDADVAAMRARMDGLSEMFPQVPGTTIEPATVGGVKGDWVRVGDARRDAVLLYLHGGGYMAGSPKSHRHLIAAFSQASGLSVFAPDYRLAPENPFPAAVDDALAVYKALLDSGIAADKLAIAGDSAGGGLTVATLIAARDKKLPMPACAVCISPWADLSQSGEAYRTRASRDPMITKAGLDQGAAMYLAGKDAKSPLASPVFADLKGLPPLLLQVGTEEALYDDTTALKARAESAGVEVSAESWAGMVHVWHAFYPLLSEGRDAIARVGAYIGAHIA